MGEALTANIKEEASASNSKDAMHVLEERINETMVGRDNEIECFIKQFDRVLEGGMGLNVISGNPGAGKTLF